jgi:hypothetical protein
MLLPNVCYGLVLPLLAASCYSLSIPVPEWGPTDIVEVEQVLRTFSVAVDTKQWDMLDLVFAANATADFGDGSDIIRGRDTIRDAIREGQELALSQHYLSTIVVRGQRTAQAGKTSAIARSYLQGVFFGTGPLENQTLITYG